VGNCCGRCGCQFGTPCISGTGRPSDPWDFVIPAGDVVPHPLAPGFLPDTANGLACTPDGLEAPQPGFPNGSSSDISIGSLPDIVASQAAAPWGPVLSDAMTNLNDDRFELNIHAVVHPYVTAVLETGASFRYGIILDPNGLAIYLPLWGASNFSGLAVETYSLLPQTAYNGPFFLAPSAISSIEYQSWIEASGFTGLSSIATLGQAGLGIRQLGVPL